MRRKREGEEQARRKREGVGKEEEAGGRRGEGEGRGGSSSPPFSPLFLFSPSLVAFFTPLHPFLPPLVPCTNVLLLLTSPPPPPPPPPSLFLLILQLLLKLTKHPQGNVICRSVTRSICDNIAPQCHSIQISSHINRTHKDGAIFQEDIIIATCRIKFLAHKQAQIRLWIDFT